MNENIFTNTRGMIHSIEMELMARLSKPDLFTQVLRVVLIVLLAQLQVYHEMRELAASNHHNVQFSFVVLVALFCKEEEPILQSKGYSRVFLGFQSGRAKSRN